LVIYVTTRREREREREREGKVLREGESIGGLKRGVDEGGMGRGVCVKI
jgi:hypothetical protein